MANVPKQVRENIGGNFCLHDPLNPSLVLAVAPSQKIPLVLQDAIKRIDNYYFSPQMLDALNLANRSSRQQRSERREACILVLKALFKFTEMASLRVGQPTESGFLNYSYKLLINHTGLSRSRFVRAMDDLKAAKFVTVTELYTINERGEYEGVSAVKCVSALLFETLGLGDALEKARKYASKKLKKTGYPPKQYSRTGKAKMRLLAKSQAPDLTPKTRPRYQPPPNQPDRQTQTIALGLKSKHPDWPAEKLYKAAQKLLNK